MAKIKKGDWVMIRGPKGVGEVQFLGTDGELAYISTDGIRVSGMDLERFMSMVIQKPQLASLQDLEVSGNSNNEGEDL